MADSKLGSSLKQASKDLKNAFLEKVCREIDYAAATSMNGKIPYGFITKIMNETKDEQPMHYLRSRKVEGLKVLLIC